MAKPAAAAAGRIAVHPAIRMKESWAAALPAKTGRSLDQWVELAKRKGPKDEAALRAWLKQQHDHGTNAAGWIAVRALGKTDGAEDTAAGYLAAAPGFVDALFAGPKAALRPLYDRVLAVAFALGDDVTICPCQTIVPVYRAHVIAQLKPGTRTRLDLGLALAPLLKQGKKLPSRLIDTGGFAKKDRITHRIPIERDADIDKDVEKWLRTAYELDA